MCFDDSLNTLFVRTKQKNLQPDFLCRNTAIRSRRYCQKWIFPEIGLNLRDLAFSFFEILLHLLMTTFRDKDVC
jgi:hypothetical protein